MKKKIFLSFALLSLLITSCKKEKYQPAGNYVVSGTNSNTVKKYDFTVYSSDWMASGSNQYYNYMGIPAGTDMNGAVMVYYYAAGYYTALPFIVSGTQSIMFAFQTNTILEVDLIGMPAQTCSFRAVIIPPGSRLQHPEVDYTNYEQVKKVFSIKD